MVSNLTAKQKKLKVVSVLFFVIDQWEEQATIHPPPAPIQHLWGTKLPPCTLLYPQHWDIWGSTASPELRVCRSNLQLPPTSLQPHSSQTLLSMNSKSRCNCSAWPCEIPQCTDPLLCLFPHPILELMAETPSLAPAQGTLGCLIHHFLQPIFQ